MTNTYSILSLTQKELNRQYLAMFNGFLKLTDREMDLMCLIVERYQSLSVDLKEEYLVQFLLNTEARKDYCTLLGISSFNCTNLLKSLKEKEALIPYKGHYTVPSMLKPQEEIRFTFSLKK